MEETFCRSHGCTGLVLRYEGLVSVVLGLQVMVGSIKVPTHEALMRTRLIALIITVLELNNTNVSFPWSPEINSGMPRLFSTSRYTPKAVGWLRDLP